MFGIANFCFIVFFSLLFSQSISNLYSPEISLPIVQGDETIHYDFMINIDLPDSDGNSDDSLEDYYYISLSEVSNSAWHSSDINSIEGDSYWCANIDNGGYLDSWSQYLDTAPVLVGSNAKFSAKLFYSIESPNGAEGEVEGSCTDGWDAANIRISVDGGVTWSLLEDNDKPYDFDCGYGWIWNDEQYELGGQLNHLAKGWGGKSNGWFDFSVDLESYENNEIIIRFAFGSDPAECIIDDNSLTGLQIDDILIEDESGVLFYDSGDDIANMNASGDLWSEQLYDYGGPSNISNPRPGVSDWERYVPGMPFNGNVFMNLTDYAGKTIKFRIQSRYDNDHNGGQGAGIFIDDFRVYVFSPGFYFAPTGLIANPLDGKIELYWDDMNESGTKDYIYDNNIFFQENNSIKTSEGNGWAGKMFDVIGPSRVNSFSIYNANEIDTTILVGLYGKIGSTINTEPIYSMNVPLVHGWNNFNLDDSSWTVENYFVIGHEINSSFGVSIDTSMTMGYSFLRLGGPWMNWAADPNLGYIGEFGIRSNITYDGANVTYNIYRTDSLIMSGLAENTYIDTGLINNAQYDYSISAIYSDGSESDKTSIVSATPLSSTVYEIGYDDGNFELDYNAGPGSFSAVRFAANIDGENLVRIKWYQVVPSGVFYIKIFDDNNGLPGEELYSSVQAGGNNNDGWNEKDLSSFNINVSEYFWAGVKEFSTSNPFGLDTSSNSNNSYQRISEDADWNAIEGNLGIRVMLDCGENCGQGSRVASDFENMDIDFVSKGELYNLDWGKKELKRKEIRLNGNLISSNFNSNLLNRMQIQADTLFILKEYEFEDQITEEWKFDSGWNLTEDNYYSPTHSIHSPNNYLENVFSPLQPNTFNLISIFPNPFNPVVNIQFEIDKFSLVSLSIHDINGRLVKNLVDKKLNIGTYHYNWNAYDYNGVQVSSGIYFIVLNNSDNLIKSKILYIK